MKGRTEDKFVAEKKIQAKIKTMPNYMRKYYYSLNEKTHMTKTRYINNVIRFLSYLDNTNEVSIEQLNSIESFDIQQYISDIQFLDNGKELQSDGKALIYSSLNSFFTFLKRQKLIENNPFEYGIERPKPKENDIVFLEPEEWAIVKSNIMNGVGSDRAKAKQKAWMYRDLLLFQIPIITGVRVTALTEISFDDINFEKHTINVIDKARHKVLFLDHETFGLLLVWMENRKNLMKGYDENGYLFISNQRKKMNIMSVEKIVEKYTYNLNKHITPHKLRSTCGTNMYRATKDIYLVADILGHTSTATTKKYTKICMEDRQNASQLIAERMKNATKF